MRLKCEQGLRGEREVRVQIRQSFRVPRGKVCTGLGPEGPIRFRSTETRRTTSADVEGTRGTGTTPVVFRGG